MKFTLEMDYYDMLTLWSYCKTEVNTLREIDPTSTVYKFLQTEADKLERITAALDNSMDEACKWYDPPRHADHEQAD